jgi:hypothetical protein
MPVDKPSFAARPAAACRQLAGAICLGKSWVHNFSQTVGSRRIFYSQSPFQGIQGGRFYGGGAFAEVPRQTFEMETRGGGVMTKTFQVQHGAAQRKPGKAGGTHGQRRVRSGGPDRWWRQWFDRASR